jgi:hypothetical protein
MIDIEPPTEPILTGVTTGLQSGMIFLNACPASWVNDSEFVIIF